MYGVGPREVFLPASDGGAQAPTLILNACGAGPSHPPVPRRVVTNDHPLGRRSVPLLQLRRPRGADRLALGKRCDAGRRTRAEPIALAAQVDPRGLVGHVGVGADVLEPDVGRQTCQRGVNRIDNLCGVNR